MKKYIYIPDAPLKKGDRGMHVDRLQYALDTILKYRGKNKTSAIEPAYFGDTTMHRLASFQAAQGIKITGVYDSLTRQKLREASQCRS